MTEQIAGGALGWLQHNVEINKAAGKSLDNLDTAACDWNDYIALLNTDKNNHSSDDAVKANEGEAAMDVTLADTEWDLIIGSDLVYNEAGVMMLPLVMKALSSPNTHIFYAHTKRRYEMMDFDFMAELNKNGFTVIEERENGISTPPESPPPFEFCFPPMRIAILHIIPSNNKPDNS